MAIEQSFWIKANGMEIASNRKWWKEVVVYQLYPRSFKDSNGDGIGDIKGIIEKVDYLESLGIDVIWINPIFESPDDDMGYDISDYRAIMSRFGNMEDFEILLTKLHERGIKLIIDLVVNHTSDEHPWFKESRKSRDNPYRNYYHWWNAEKGTPPYRWSIFDRENNAWKYDELANSYYFHIFSEKQPDLNWENPAVRQEIYSIMKFWLEKGVDGFRLDVIACISKDIDFPELAGTMKAGDWFPYYAKGPYLHKYLKEMNEEVFSKYNCMNVGEMSHVNTDNALLFVDEDRKELQTFYHFDHTGMGISKENFMYADPTNRDLVEWKKIFFKWDQTFATKGWGTVYLGNHDMSRMVSRFGNDSEEYRELSAKMLHCFLLSWRGTPYIYNGDEIGMVNTNHTQIEKYRDIYTINYYNQLKQKGEDYEGFLQSHATICRDNSRTPFQWNDQLQAGFTTGIPWLEVHTNYTKVNAAEQEKRNDSVLNFFRQMVKLRKKTLTLIYGAVEAIDAENPQLFAYTRSLDGEKLLVVLNFSDQPASLTSNIDFEASPILISNYPDLHARSVFRPYEAVIFKIA